MSENQVDLGALFEEFERTSALTVLPEGKHRLRVASATVKNRGIQPVFEILEGPDAGKRMMAGGIFPGETEGGRIAFFNKLRKFGLGKEFFSQKPSLEDVRKALIGRVVILGLTIKTWNEEPRNEMGFDIQLVEAPALPAIGGVPQVASAPPVPTPQVTPTTTTQTVAGSDSAPIPTGTDPDPGF